MLKFILCAYFYSRGCRLLSTVLTEYLSYASSIPVISISAHLSTSLYVRLSILHCLFFLPLSISFSPFLFLPLSGSLTPSSFAISLCIFVPSSDSLYIFNSLFISICLCRSISPYTHHALLFIPPNIYISLCILQYLSISLPLCSYLSLSATLSLSLCNSLSLSLSVTLSLYLWHYISLCHSIFLYISR